MMKYFTSLLLLMTTVLGLSQDPQYSQFYASPLYLNPAFAGVNLGFRAHSIYRTQWTGIPSRPFTTFSLSVDHEMEKIHSGVGVLVTRDRAGTSKLSYTNVSAIYSYNLHIHDKWVALAGLQAGYTRFSLDYSQLKFRSQFDPEEGFTGSSSGENVAGAVKAGVPDFSSGLLLYNKNFWMGTTAHHINRPNYSFGSNSDVTIPMRFSVQSGFKFKVTKGRFTHKQKEFSFSPAILYRSEEKFDQLDVGMYVNYNPIVTGLWFRGLPGIKKYDNIRNYDAIVFLIGFHQDGLTIGYTYDITISKLGGRSGGAHEISVGYEFAYPEKKRKKYTKFLPCPQF